MKNKVGKSLLLIFGVLVLFLLLAGPIMAKLGFDTFCITGKLPDLHISPCSSQSAADPIVTAYPLPTAYPDGPIPIIFDDDGSPDGLIALMFFLRNPLYDVKAVTISQGEAHPKLFSRHVTLLLASLGRNDIPVGYGRETPLEGTNAFPEPWRTASDLFFGIPLSESPNATEPIPAAELILSTLSQSPEPVVLFISGTHTNLAEVLRTDPDIKEKISGVYIMGGSIYQPGNIESDWPDIPNNVAEWNIWVDPLAAREVFNSGLSLHLVPLDATNQITWFRADAQRWTSTSHPETIQAGKLLDWMLGEWTLDAVFIWDLVAAVTATDPRLCPETHLNLDVKVGTGPDQGQIIRVDEGAQIQVCLQPDRSQIRARIDLILGK